MQQPTAGVEHKGVLEAAQGSGSSCRVVTRHGQLAVVLQQCDGARQHAVALHQLVGFVHSHLLYARQEVAACQYAHCLHMCPLTLTSHLTENGELVAACLQCLLAIPRGLGCLQAIGACMQLLPSACMPIKLQCKALACTQLHMLLTEAATSALTAEDEVSSPELRGDAHLQHFKCEVPEG